MAGVLHAGAPLRTNDSLLYLVSPFVYPPPLFPHWLGTPGSQFYQRFTFVNSCVIWCQSVAILLCPRCLSLIDTVIFFKVLLNKEHRGVGRMPGLPDVSSGASLGMSWLVLWFDKSRAGYSCNVYDKIYICTPIYWACIPGEGLCRG